MPVASERDLWVREVPRGASKIRGSKDVAVKLLTEGFPGIHQYLFSPKDAFCAFGEETKCFLGFSQSHERETTSLETNCLLAT